MTSGPEQFYFTSLRQGRFLIQRCTACERAVFYPRTHCVHCGSPSLRWIEPTGRGTVFSTTTVRRKQDKGGDYNVSVIELDEGVRLMSRVDGAALPDVRIGMKVQAHILNEDDACLLVFHPLQETE